MKKIRFILFSVLFLISELIFAEQGQGRGPYRGGQMDSSSLYIQIINELIEKTIEANKPFSREKEVSIAEAKTNLNDCSFYRRDLIVDCVSTRSAALMDRILSKERHQDRSCEASRIWQRTGSYSYNFQYVLDYSGSPDTKYKKIYEGTVLKVLSPNSGNSDHLDLVRVEVLSIPSDAGVDALPAGSAGYVWSKYLSKACR